MKLTDLSVGLRVLLIKKEALESDFTRVDGGFVCNTTKKFMSDEMVNVLIGKTVTVEVIDEEDDIMSVKVDGFWISPTWILKKAPKLRQKKLIAGKDIAADGSQFGPIFKAIIKKCPDLGVLSTNRLSKLTPDELRRICEGCGVDYNSSDQDSMFQNIIRSL